MTTANEIKFGVEVETHLSVNDTTQVGSYYSPRQVSWLPSGWNVGKDCSINYPYGRKDAEFASPVLEGEEGLKEVYESVAKIRDRGAKVNSSCGIHVTVTFPRDNAPALARLIHLVAHFEKGLFASTGTNRREQGIYCKKVSQYGENVAAKEKAKRVEERAKGDRYHALNLTHLGAGQNRVEFRLFSGSTNPEKVVAWVRLVLAIVEYALNSERCIQFENRTKSTKYGGPGETNLRLAFYKFAWLKNRARNKNADKVYGKVTPEGLPSMEESAKTLIKMAKKYDAQ